MHGDFGNNMLAVQSNIVAIAVVATTATTAQRPSTNDKIKIILKKDKKFGRSKKDLRGLIELPLVVDLVNTEAQSVQVTGNSTELSSRIPLTTLVSTLGRTLGAKGKEK